MAQLEHIEAIEKRLWSAADNLRGILPKDEYQKLDNEVLGSAALLIPPKILQEQFSDSISVIFCQRDMLLRHNSRLGKARDLLLPRLMNGEVAV